MRIRTGIAALAVVVIAGLVAGASAVNAAGLPSAATAAAGQAGAPYCGITWGSLPASGGDLLSAAPLVTTRTGQHSCYDRVVFEFKGSADGYVIEYGDPHTDGEGLNLAPYTAGGATLSVRLLAPAHDQAMRPTYPYRVGDHTANVVRYRTLRDVVFGGSMEGYTTFSVGVRARLPFRVMVLDGPGTHSRIVLDIAHQWQQ